MIKKLVKAVSWCVAVWAPLQAVWEWIGKGRFRIVAVPDQNHVWPILHYIAWLTGYLVLPGFLVASFVCVAVFYTTGFLVAAIQTVQEMRNVEIAKRNRTSADAAMNVAMGAGLVAAILVIWTLCRTLPSGPSDIPFHLAIYSLRAALQNLTSASHATAYRVTLLRPDCIAVSYFKDATLSLIGATILGIAYAYGFITVKRARKELEKADELP